MNTKTHLGCKLSMIILLLILQINLEAQTNATERKLVREGNKKYIEKQFSDAETIYRKAMQTEHGSPTGTYNLGNALYRQKKYDEAVQQYPSTINSKANNESKAKAYHNLGNTYLEQQKYQESVDAYKQALKLNSKDEQTRYNYAYAKSKLVQQQQQQQQQNKDDKQQQKKDDKQQEQKQDDKKEQDKNQQQQQQQDKEQEQKKKEEQQQQAQQKPKISKEDAERMLQALKKDEKDLQKKMHKKEGTRSIISKNW
nr:tetratricopeptide repeat protein [Bacteroidota bacterium]